MYNRIIRLNNKTVSSLNLSFTLVKRIFLDMLWIKGLYYHRVSIWELGVVLSRSPYQALALAKSQSCCQCFGNSALSKIPLSSI